MADKFLLTIDTAANLETLRAASGLINGLEYHDSTNGIRYIATAANALTPIQSFWQRVSTTVKTWVLGDSVQIGTNTNNATFEADGFMQLNGTGTYFEDVRVAPNVRGTGSQNPSFEKYQDNGAGSIGVYAYSFDNALVGAQKEIYFSIQMPHAKKLDSVIHLHAHWVPKTAGTAGHKVKWGLEYSWSKLGDAFGATTIVYADTTTLGDIATALSHSLTEFADITPPATETISSILWGRIFRFSSDAGDTATITAGLLMIDAHIECDTLGSRTELSK